jgi:peptidylprolyl isomerase
MTPMKTAKQGDRVRVHYVKRLEDGGVASSRASGPLELTVGVAHPRLPGLGLALVGLSPGSKTTLVVPPERAYGLADPKRKSLISRSRFEDGEQLVVGQWSRMLGRAGQGRLVRVLEVRDDGMVLVDLNHRGAGQTMQLRVKLIGIQGGAE